MLTAADVEGLFADAPALRTGAGVAIRGHLVRGYVEAVGSADSPAMFHTAAHWLRERGVAEGDVLIDPATGDVYTVAVIEPGATPMVATCRLQVEQA